MHVLWYASNHIRDSAHVLMRPDCVVAVCGRRCGAVEAATAATIEGGWLRYARVLMAATAVWWWLIKCLPN